MKFLTAFLTAVLFTAPALAQGRRAEKPSGQRGSRGEALQAHLQLNEQQKEALRANRQALRKETRVTGGADPREAQSDSRTNAVGDTGR